MNPEFRRQLTLELTPSRLVLMPAILLLLGACAYLLETNVPLKNLHDGALLIMGLLGAGVGAFTALGSINDEINERTWDQQRMSALGPWPMAWGKLLGGPSYAWYGVLLCAVVALVSSFMLGHGGRSSKLVFLGVLGIATLHCGLMASRLFGMNPSKPSSTRSTWGLVILLLFLLQMLSGVFFGLEEIFEPQQQIRWWGWGLPPTPLMLVFAVLFLLLGLLALWRAMAMQLSVPTTPWAWVLGNTALCLLLAGLLPEATARVLAILFLLMLATYYAAVIENQVPQRWRTVLYSLRHGQWRRFWQNLPLWPISWGMAFVVLLPAYILWNADPLAARDQLGPFMLMVLLHVLRDCGVYLFFALRNNARSPLGMTVLVLFVLGAILPAMFWSAGLAPLFEPLFGIFTGKLYASMRNVPALGWLAWIGMLLQLAVLGAALLWRFGQLMPKNEARNGS